MNVLKAEVTAIEFFVQHELDGTVSLAFLGVLKEGTTLEQLCVHSRYSDTREKQPGKVILRWLTLNALDFITGQTFIRDFHRQCADLGQIRLLQPLGAKELKYFNESLEEWKREEQRESERLAEEVERANAEANRSGDNEEISSQTTYRGQIIDLGDIEPGTEIRSDESGGLGEDAGRVRPDDETEGTGHTA